MDSFSSFKLNQSLIDSVHHIGFKEPTEIQVKSIPSLLAGRDLIAQSKTGSGKTAAFILPMMNFVLSGDQVGLVLVPTRELALQVSDFAKKLITKHIRLKTATLIGGGSIQNQHRDLMQRPNIIVATPGRFNDLLNRGSIKTSKIRMVVFDEADRMLDMGFYPQIKKAMAKIPTDRQTALFSATFSDDIRKLIKEFAKSPVEVSAGIKNETPVTINQQIIETSSQQKNDALVDELNARQGSVLIFTKTKSKSDRLAKFLLSYGFKVSRIHGDRTLAQRTKSIQEFRDGSVRILVATDIVARGIDISHVGHVINFDLPQNAEDYLHRIGRTGRAGASGQAVSFVTPEERRRWKDIVRFSAQKMGNKSIPQLSR